MYRMVIEGKEGYQTVIGTILTALPADTTVVEQKACLGEARYLCACLEPDFPCDQQVRRTDIDVIPGAAPEVLQLARAERGYFLKSIAWGTTIGNRARQIMGRQNGA